jgi:hypothetical protein
MTNQLTTPNGFYAQHNSCKVWYSKTVDYKIYKLTDLKSELIYCKNTHDYIRTFIEHLKDNVIRNFKNLGLVSIQLCIFDKDNILHKFIIKITTMLRNILIGKKMPSVYTSIFVVVKYENNIVFMGLVDFAGLQ